ncbi:MAG TPA: OmpH family outer membrane protein [Rhizomicrobium sp.]|jgi:outer membrane protein
MTTIALRTPAVRTIMGIAAAILLGSAVLAAPAKPAAPPPNQGAVATRILVIDRNVLLRASKAGQSMVAQINGYRSKAETEFRAQGQALQREGQALQQQVAILAPDVKAKKIRDFQAKQSDFQRKLEQRQGLIQGGLYKAQQQVEAALKPILQQIMQERGANLLLDRGAVVLVPNSMDVTAMAVQRLDQKLPSVKVDLVALPPGLQQAQAR